MSDDASLSKALTCSCGVYAKNPELMRMHLAEGYCTPSEAQTFLLRDRIRKIAVERESLSLRIVSLSNEETLLHGMIASYTAGVPIRPRPTREEKLQKLAIEKAEMTWDQKLYKAGHKDVTQANILRKLFE